MTKTKLRNVLVASAGVATMTGAGLALLPVAVVAAPGHTTRTLRFYDQQVAVKVTHADGTVVTKPPFPDPAPGDVLEVDSRDFPGTSKHHARRWTGSGHLVCTFGATPAPDCQSWIAFDRSILSFRGNPGTLVFGTGVYEGATGRVVSNRTLDDGGSDIVVKLELAGGR